MSEDVRKRIGAMLRALREERGFSLGHVQHLTHDIDWPISRSRLSQLERGEVEVHLSDLYPLSRTYGFSIGSLISEAIIAHSKKKFAKGLTADELFEQAKELFRIGKPLEAAWTFDEAGRRAEDGKTDFRHLCMISAGHCYERLDAYDLALKRVEAVIDAAEEGSPDAARSLAKAARLRAATGSKGRARIYVMRLAELLAERQSTDLKAYLEGTLAETHALLGDMDAAIPLARASARRYSRLGNFDMAAKLRAGVAEYEMRRSTPSLGRALRSARDAAALLSESSEMETRARVQVILGECLLAAAENRSAHDVSIQALEDANRINDTDLSRRALQVLSTSADRLGEKKQRDRWQKRLETLEQTRRRIGSQASRSGGGEVSP